MATPRSATGFTRWDPITNAVGTRIPEWDRRLILVNADIHALRQRALDEEHSLLTAVGFREKEAAALAHVHQLAALGAVVVVPSRTPAELGAWAAPDLVVAKLVHTQADLDTEKLFPDLFKGMSAAHALVLCPQEPLDLREAITCPLCGGTGIMQTHHESYAVENTSCACHGRGPVDFVIFDGPTGMNAWPIHPEWVRSARNICAAKGIPFAFLGWGAYGFEDRAFESFSGWVNKASAWLDAGAICLDTAGRVLENGDDFMRARDEKRFPVAIGHHLGHRNLGRTLDGEEHLELPELVRVTW
jgi:hypothetical protein